MYEIVHNLYLSTYITLFLYLYQNIEMDTNQVNKTQEIRYKLTIVFIRIGWSTKRNISDSNEHMLLMSSLTQPHIDTI